MGPAGASPPRDDVGATAAAVLLGGGVAKDWLTSGLVMLGAAPNVSTSGKDADDFVRPHGSLESEAQLLENLCFRALERKGLRKAVGVRSISFVLRIENSH